MSLLMPTTSWPIFGGGNGPLPVGREGEGDVAVGSLRSDLLNIPGIESAELEGDADTPAGVRVRLAAGVDIELIGEEIRRVLATHGLRSELAGEQSIVTQVPAPGESGHPPIRIAPVPDAESETAVVPAAGAAVTTITAEPAGSSAPPSAPRQPDVPAVSLASVAVEEGRTGVSVVAAGDDGSRMEQRARQGATGVDEAVVAAVARLLRPDDVPPLIVAITAGEIEGSDVVTVVLDVDGDRVVGSTVVEGGRPYAVGRAVWAALSST